MKKTYDYSKAARLTDLYSQEFLESLDLHTDQLTTVNFKRGKRVKFEFIRSVFTAYLKAVVQDCITYNSRFISPGRFWFSLYIAPTTNENVERVIRNGIYQSVDLIASDFKIYEFFFNSPYLKRGDMRRKVRISYPKYQELIQGVNKGKRYPKSKKIRHYKYYFRFIREQFPNLREEQIESIVREGCYQMHKFVADDQRDVQIKNNFHLFYMTIYKFIPRSKLT